jgi:hypothetical protein
MKNKFVKFLVSAMVMVGIYVILLIGMGLVQALLGLFFAKTLIPWITTGLVVIGTALYLTFSKENPKTEKSDQVEKIKKLEKIIYDLEHTEFLFQVFDLDGNHIAMGTTENNKEVGEAMEVRIGTVSSKEGEVRFTATVKHPRTEYTFDEGVYYGKG